MTRLGQAASVRADHTDLGRPITAPRVPRIPMPLNSLRSGFHRHLDGRDLRRSQAFGYVVEADAGLGWKATTW